VNVALALNWFGDSLDGTVARFRRTPRPRYGFYVDHLLDSIGSTLLIVGMAVGGLVRPWLAAALLVAYLLVSIEVYLATYTLARFKIAYAGLGGTELRIVLALVNVATFAWPGRVLWGASAYDAVAALATAGLVVTLATTGWRNGRELYEAERV
jgi:phosphatidylglycerophosphate synthase